MKTFLRISYLGTLLLLPLFLHAQDSNKIGVLQLTVSDVLTSDGAFRMFQSNTFDASACSRASRKDFLAYLIANYPEVRRVNSSISLDPLVDQDGIQGNNLQLVCMVKLPADYQHDLAWFSSNPGHLVMTHWKPAASSAPGQLLPGQVVYYCTYGGMDTRTIYYSQVFGAKADDKPGITNAWFQWLKRQIPDLPGDKGGCSYDPRWTSLRQGQDDRNGNMSETRHRNNRVVEMNWSYQ